MRKIIALLIFAVTLGFASCTETNDLSVAFGDRTYTNDYAKLVEAVNNISNSYTTRFGSLDSLIDAGMVKIKLAIDSNTTVLNILDQTTKAGLDSINARLFNGFSALSLQMSTNNSSLVNAIDNNGNLLRVHLDSLNNVTNTTLINNNDTLIKVLNASTDSLKAKLALIDAAVAAGFTSITQAQEATTTAINTLKDQVAVDTVYYKQMLESFSALNQNAVAINNALGVLSKNDTTTIQALVAMREVLELALSDDGITIDSGGYILYLSPQVWALIEDKDSTSGVYNSFLGAIKNSTSYKEYNSGNDFSLESKHYRYHGNTGGTAQDTEINTCTKIGYSDQMALVSDSMKVLSTSSSKNVVKVVKIPAWVQYSIAAGGGSTNYYFCIRVFDARGDYQTFGRSIGSRTYVGDITASSSTVPVKTCIVTTAKTVNLALCHNGKACKSSVFQIHLFSYDTSGTDSKYYPSLFWPSDYTISSAKSWFRNSYRRK